MYLTLSLIVGAITLIYLYFVWNFDYWKKRGVKGPTPVPFFGSLKSVVLHNKCLTYDVNDVYKTFKGETFAGIFMLRTPQIVAIEPDLIKELMISNFKHFVNNEFAYHLDKKTDPIFARNPFMLKDKEWKDKRAELSPAFTYSRIKSIYPIIQNSCSKLTKHIKEKTSQNSADGFQAKTLIDKYTLDLVSNSIFGHDPEAFSDDHNIFVEMADAIAEQTFQLYNRIFWGSGLPVVKYFWNAPFFTKKVVDFFNEMTKNAITYRESTKIEQNDYLQFLIDLKKKKEIPDIDMAANEGLVFIDAVDTASLLISNGLYSLGDDKRVQEKLREEIRRTIKEFGKIDYDVLMDKMPYLDQVTNEALRFHPPIPITTRQCTESVEVSLRDNSKITIEKGTTALIPIWSIQHDPEHYPDPESFYPERFDDENGGIKAFKDKGVFLPFGGGPKICLGMRMVILEIKAAFVEVIQNFELSVNKRTIQPLELDRNEFFYVPKGGVWLDFKEI